MTGVKQLQLYSQFAGSKLQRYHLSIQTEPLNKVVKSTLLESEVGDEEPLVKVADGVDLLLLVVILY